MPDIRDVLQHAAPPVSEIDIDRVSRGARRRRAVPRVLAGCVAAAALLAGVLVVTQGDDGPGRITSGTTPDSTISTNVTTTTVTTTTAPPTTTTPPPSVPVGEDRLSTESRLGYAGLGPIKLGMTVDEAVAAAQAPPQSEGYLGCPTATIGGPNNRVSLLVWYRVGSQVIDGIVVNDPSIRTISGVGVGTSRSDVVATYPEAVQLDDRSDALLITGNDGHVIEFGFAADGTVSYMDLASTREVQTGHSTC